MKRFVIGWNPLEQKTPVKLEEIAMDINRMGGGN